MKDINKQNLKFMKKAIKQIHSVICAFDYRYFYPLEKDPSPEEWENMEKFRNETLFKLVDQWKKMELEYRDMQGLVPHD